LKFYSGPEGSKILSNYKNCVPGLKKVAYDKNFLQPPPDNIGENIDAIYYSVAAPQFYGYKEFLQQVLQPAIEKIFLKKETVEEATARCVREFSRFKPQP